jgi:predicted RND superfamily exporter protein
MKALKIIIFTILVITVTVFVVPQFKSKAIKILSFSECDTPMSYKLGSLDPKFGLSQTTTVTDIQNAADIWGKTYGKPLFINSITAALTINFVFDKRSALNTRIDQLQNQVNQKNATLEQQINSYKADVAAFEQKLSSFNAQVAQINKSGGAAPDVYNNLIAQQNELHAEGDSLNTRASQFNLATHDYNSQVQSLNQNINQFNQALTQNPEEGFFNPNNKTITIYFAGNYKELVHTLAHEFGHALGMEHTDAPQSIMYPNATSFLSVTSEDKHQLDYVCREQSLLSHWLQEFAVWLHSTINSG